MGHTILGAIVGRGAWLVNSVALNGPIEDVLVFKAASVEELFENLLIPGVIRGLFELQLPAVGHVLCELFRIAMAKLLDGGVDLAFFDLAIFVVLVSGAESLPRELSFEQVENNVASTL